MKSRFLLEIVLLVSVLFFLGNATCAAQGFLDPRFVGLPAKIMKTREGGVDLTIYSDGRITGYVVESVHNEGIVLTDTIRNNRVRLPIGQIRTLNTPNWGMNQQQSSRNYMGFPTFMPGQPLQYKSRPYMMPPR